jgi:MYXO-CTERM domain-containing protein
MALNSYALITSGLLALPSTRNAGAAAALDDANSQTVVFGNGTAYDHYLVVFTTVKDSGSANSVQIAEVQLNTIPEPSTAVLGALGLTFLAALRRPRRSSGI